MGINLKALQSTMRQQEDMVLTLAAFIKCREGIKGEKIYADSVGMTEE